MNQQQLANLQAQRDFVSMYNRQCAMSTADLMREYSETVKAGDSDTATNAAWILLRRGVIPSTVNSEPTDASRKRATLAAKRDGTPHVSCNCPACTAQRYTAWQARRG